MPVPSSPPSVERTLLRDRVTDKIRTAILDGTLEPGERLHDDQLIAWLGVSRTPIREALAQLAGEGLIDMVANRSTRGVLRLRRRRPEGQWSKASHDRSKHREAR